MSRLYGRLKSDRRKTDATVGANHHLETHLTWGNASNPKTALEVLLVWNKDAEYPFISIDIADDIDYKVYVGGELMGDHNID